MAFTDDQKRGIKPLIGAIGLIVLLLGALTDVYDVITGLMIALIIWILLIPLLKVLGLSPERAQPTVEQVAGAPGSPTQQHHYVHHQSSPFWRSFLIVVIIILAIGWGASYALGRGSGVLTTEIREVKDFSKVELSGTGSITQLSASADETETDESTQAAE